jgi:hypothetical protein
LWRATQLEVVSVVPGRAIEHQIPTSAGMTIADIVGTEVGTYSAIKVKAQRTDCAFGGCFQWRVATQVENTCDSLAPRERRVLQLHFGLVGG